MVANDPYKHEKSMENIKNCPLNKIKDDSMNRNKICQQKNNCQDFLKSSLRSPILKDKKGLACECGEKMPFQCGHNFCTLDEKVCKTLRLADQKYLKNLDFCKYYF